MHFIHNTHTPSYLSADHLADTSLTSFLTPHFLTTSVDILNDLLTFEKIQSGIMEVHKNDVNVMAFVQDCCGIFKAQARAKDITMHVLFSDVAVVGSSDIEDTDLVRFDKFKISQVVSIRHTVCVAL